MSKTGSKAVLRNILHGLSAWILPLLLSLVVTRVVVRSLGTGDYGIYALVLGFISYSFNFSIGRAITKFLAARRSTEDDDKIHRIVSATVILTFAVAAVGSILILTLSRWLVTDVFALDAASQEKTVTGIRLAAAIISVLMIGQLATSIFQGLQRFDVYSKIQNATSVITMLGNLGLAYFGYGLLPLLYWNLAATAIFAAVGLVAARSLLIDGRLFVLPGRDAMLTVLRYSASVIGYQVVGNAFFLFERGWIISKLGADELTYYAVPMTIGLFLHGFMLSLNIVLFPLTSELSDDRDRLLRLYQTATRSVMLVVFIVVVSLVAAGRLFLDLWLGPDFGEHSGTLLAVQSVAFGIASINIVSFQTAEGLGRPAFNFRNTSFGAIAAFVLTVLLTGSLGSLAVACGRVAFFFIPMLAIFDLERRCLGGFRSGFWLKYLTRLSIACLVAYIIENVIVSIVAPSWLGLFAAVGSGLIAYALILFGTGYLTAEDRRLIGRLVT